MVAILENIIAVIVVLGVLITFHEFGHFWVARRCGIKVLRFSVGFGKPLWSRRDRQGTEFAIAAIPLGGYVKMLDEREGEVAQVERHRAFNRQSVWKRILVVVAGPVANFLLAGVIYWALFIHGVTALVPVVGSVSPHSAAAQAGLASGEEITRVDGHPVLTWQDINLRLVDMIGHTGTIDMMTAGGHRYELPVSRYLVDQNPPEPLSSLGVVPWQPRPTTRLALVKPDSPAAQAGLAEGDRILAVNGETLDDWEAFTRIVRHSIGKPLALKVKVASGDLVEKQLTPTAHAETDGHQVGYAGAAAAVPPYPKRYLRSVQYSPLAAVPEAIGRTWDMSWLTLNSIGKMLAGLISPSNLSGPVTIARVAGASARSGVESFAGFLAYLSISLGVLNLMPIPMLDGGHLLYFVVEAIRRRPLSERTQVLGLKVGMLLVGALMIMAFYFDLMRL